MEINSLKLSFNSIVKIMLLKYVKEVDLFLEITYASLLVDNVNWPYYSKKRMN